MRNPSNDLPDFRYYPDPYGEEGAFRPTENLCELCGESCGWVHHHAFYSAKGNGDVCPWCVKSGRAAKEFNGKFNPLDWESDADARNTTPRPVGAHEVMFMTPGLSTWQEQSFPDHCGECCAYLGPCDPDAVRADVGRYAAALSSAFDGWFPDNKPEPQRLAEDLSVDLILELWRCLRCGADVGRLDPS